MQGGSSDLLDNSGMPTKPYQVDLKGALLTQIFQQRTVQHQHSVAFERWSYTRLGMHLEFHIPPKLGDGDVHSQVAAYRPQ